MVSNEIVVQEFVSITKRLNEDDVEDLTGLLAIYVKHMRPPSENWKRLIEELNHV